MFHCLYSVDSAFASTTNTLSCFTALTAQWSIRPLVDQTTRRRQNCRANQTTKTRLIRQHEFLTGPSQPEVFAVRNEVRSICSSTEIVLQAGVKAKGGAKVFLAHFARCEVLTLKICCIGDVQSTCELTMPKSSRGLRC